MQDKTIMIKIGKELKDKILKKAKQRGLTMSTYIKMIITEDLKDE